MKYVCILRKRNGARLLDLRPRAKTGSNPDVEVLTFMPTEAIHLNLRLTTVPDAEFGIL